MTTKAATANGMSPPGPNYLSRIAEREPLQREKLVLQLENALLRFEKPLPPPAETKKLR